MWASSMGLSCVVQPEVDILTVTISWGQYAKSEVLDDAGNPHRQWSRESVQRIIHVRLGHGASQRIPLTMPDPRQPGVYLAVEIREHASGGRVVEIGLVNAQHRARGQQGHGVAVPAEADRHRRRRDRAGGLLPDRRSAGGLRRPTATMPRTGTCGCFTATSSSTPSAATSPSTRACATATGAPTGWRRPGCRPTRCPRRSRRPPETERCSPASSYPWRRWRTRRKQSSRTSSRRWREGYDEVARRTGREDP